jgi:DNA-directed RNA polymerase specialized sigma24 family protein
MQLEKVLWTKRSVAGKCSGCGEAIGADETCYRKTSEEEEYKALVSNDSELVCLDCVQEYREDRTQELTSNTLLAEREAEAYILTEELGYTIQEAADEMSVGFGRVSGARSRIKEKIQKVNKTSELEM